MRQLKYIVSLPIPDTNPVEYKDYKFHDKKDVCEFLDIKPTTFIRICDGTLQYKHKTLQRLYGIKIVKQPSIKPQKVTPDIIKSEADAYITKLLQTT